MLNHPLVMLLMTGLLAAIGSYLINQLPAIKEFPGRNILIFKLTVEILVLAGIYGWWNTTTDKNGVLKIFCQTIGSLTLLLLIWHTSQLIISLWRTRGKSSGTLQTLNSATRRKMQDEWRRHLLEAMKIYVTARLKDSLHKDDMIRLQLENRHEQIGRTAAAQITNNPSSALDWLQPKRLLKVLRISDFQVESGKPIIEIFDQPDIKGRLLILGEPGSGKTTLLLELARELIERAQQQLDEPIPVLFELTNWKDDKQNIGDWLIADLKFHYNVPETISRDWLNTDKLVPLLDGLDELGFIRQKKSIEKINEFLQNNSSLLPLVVCCRQEEYIKGEEILRQLRGAVYLQPLTPEQIQKYLRRLRVTHLWQSIQHDPEGLGKLAEIPLFLYIITFAYPQELVRKGKHFSSEQERQAYQYKCRKELFDTYINRCLEQAHDNKVYSLEDTKRWLKWLAKKMKERNKKEFYIEQLQPDYVDNWKDFLKYWLMNGIILGIFLGLFFVILGDIFEIPQGFLSRVLAGIVTGILIGINFAIYGFLNLIPYKSIHKIRPIESIKFSFVNVIIGIILGLIFGSFYGRVLVVQFPQINGQMYGWMFGILFGICCGLIGENLRTKYTPNQGIKESVKNAFIFTCIVFPVAVLIFATSKIISNIELSPGVLVILSLCVSLIFGLIFGGIPAIQHLALRLVLWHSKSIPWNYARFLSYADERKLIQQVGGRYQFIHDLLQEHFANM